MTRSFVLVNMGGLAVGNTVTILNNIYEFNTRPFTNQTTKILPITDVDRDLVMIIAEKVVKLSGFRDPHIFAAF